MKLKWEKKGVIYCPSNEREWANNSALQPTPYLLDEDTIRVYCGFRDKNGVGRVGFVDVAAKNPSIIKFISKTPALDIGEPGMFDDNGVVPTHVLKVGNSIYLYYAGYCLLDKVRFFAFTGLAVSRDGGLNFVRYQNFPITDRRNKEELFRVIHTIFYDENKYKAWYGGGNHFIEGKYKTLPVYDIRYMESSDGIKFPDCGEIAITIPNGCHRVGRPWVYKENAIYKMFYGYGSEAHPYKLAYATSIDGIAWDAQDINLTLFSSGFDSQMMAYPAFIKVNGCGFLFYNGNDYGKTGIGYAKLLC
ncbi:MAG: hypothetical protein LBD69_02955 [Puniceicoccales bacterium]|jgi:hypothetical protein|nr:hypothetical protein [Puniceicoccales bacterium]